MKLEPVVAGTFYPGKPAQLRAALDSFEKTAPFSLKGPVRGLFLPHAGYVYSGEVAALGYRSLTRPPKTLVVAGPSHYVGFKGASLFAGESVVTPLGEIPVDQEACELLMGLDPHLNEIPSVFSREHSVEVHFPLIQRYCPGAQVVPIVMGQGIEEAVEPLVRALLALGKKKDFLLVASSDLSHYPAYETAVKADRQFLEALLSGDETKVEKTDKAIMAKRYREYYCTHCGKEPTLTLLRYARAVGATQTQLLACRNSGDVTGDSSQVVGYGAVAFCEPYTEGKRT